MTPLDTFVTALEQLDCRPRRNGSGQWQARCPAHHDRNPSLSFTERDGRVLVKCHAGCRTEEIVERLRLAWPDLFPEGAPPLASRPSVPTSHDRERRQRDRTNDRSIVVRNLAASLAEAPAAPEWLWEGFLARGWITLLVGPPKAGKTTLLAGLLDAMARGRALLGLDTTAAGALVLTEQSPGVFRSTADNYSLRFGEDVDVMYLREQPPLAWAALVGEAVAYCRDEGRALLVLDTFARWAAFERDHDATEILDRMRALDSAAEAGLAVLIVHHSRKAGGQHGEEVSGRVELAAGVDVIASLVRAGDDRKLFGDGRSTLTPRELTFRVDASGFRVVEDERDGAIEEVLAELGPATLAELEERTGLPRSTLQARLRACGATVTGKRGRANVYSITTT